MELFQGPVLAPSRVTSLGGAYTAYAEGVEGVDTNAASPAVREPFSAKWFDLDVDLSLSLPGGYAGTDFDNIGSSANQALVNRTDHFLFGTLGARVQFGSFAFAVTGELLRYDVTDPQPDAPGLALAYGRYHALVAYGFWNNQLAIGGGVRAVSLQLQESQGTLAPTASSLTNPTKSFDGTTLFTMAGAAPEFGAVIKPDDAIWRAGATFRFPVQGVPSSIGTVKESSFDGVSHAGSFILPAAIVQPWELEAGFAIQLGPRPLNPRWINPHEEESAVQRKIMEARKARAEAIKTEKSDDERARLIDDDDVLRSEEERELAKESAHLLDVRKARYENWPRQKLLIVGSVLLSGASSNAVALEGFLDQTRATVGQSVTFTPRAGIEAEPIENRLKARLGGYVEPSRYADGNARQHFTAGCDVKLGHLDVFGFFPHPWQVSALVDVAPRYANYGIGFSAWH